MTGFKNFILRGNLVELAVGLRSWPSPSPPSSPRSSAWLTRPDARQRVGVLQHRREQLRRLPQRRDLVRDPRRGRLLLRRDALHQGQGEVLPSQEPGTPADIALLEEIRDLLADQQTPDAGPRPDGRSAVVRRHLRAAASRRPRSSPPVGRLGVALVAGGVGQHVAEDLGEPPALALASPRRLLVARSGCSSGGRSCAQPVGGRRPRRALGRRSRSATRRCRRRTPLAASRSGRLGEPGGRRADRVAR